MPVDYPEAPVVVSARAYTPLIAMAVSFLIVMTVLLLLRQTWVPGSVALPIGPAR